MPVPSVVTITRPERPFAAPYRTSARPAASASLTTCTSRPVASVKSLSASVPIQDLSMLAAECTTPWRTTPGTVTPTAPVQSGNFASRSTKISAIASGVDFSGVRIRSRSAANSPVSRSTGAPLMPVPPKSMPKGCAVLMAPDLMSFLVAALLRGARRGRTPDPRIAPLGVVDLEVVLGADEQPEPREPVVARVEGRVRLAEVGADHAEQRPAVVLGGAADRALQDRPQVRERLDRLVVGRLVDGRPVVLAAAPRGR